MTDKIMHSKMYGEISKFLQKYQGKTIRCFGTCRKDRVMDEFKGYEHDAGLKAIDGKKYWVYFECPKCKYGHSFSTMDFFIENTEKEHKGESNNKFHMKLMNEDEDK